MDDEFLRDILFPVIRRSLNIDSEDVLLTKESIDELIKVCLKQSILPMLYKGIKDLKLSNELIESVKRLCIGDIYLYVQRDDLLKQIELLFDEGGIAYILLKGSMLRNLYPEPWMRTCSDIDILIHESDLRNAIRLLEGNTDFRVDKRNYHDVSLLNDRICLELHFSIKETIDNIDALLCKAWHYAEYTGKGMQYRLTPEFQIFHIVAHMCYHIQNGGIGIRHFVDLWLLRHKTVYDEKLIREFCGTCRILRFYEICCDLSEVWFGQLKHTETTKLLEYYCMLGSVFGSKKLAAIGKQRNFKGKNYIMQRLFVKKSDLEEVYPEMRNKPFLMPFFQVKRWGRLLNKHRRKAAVREIEQAKSVSQQAVNEFDELLRKLGL